MIVPFPIRLRFVLPALAIWAFGATALFGQSIESPVGRRIADIVPVDNKIRSSSLILGKMTLRKGANFDDHVAASDAARLLSTGMFAPNGVEIKTSIVENGEVIVWVYVKELASVIKDIRFIGHQHYSESSLFELIPQLRKGATLNPARNRQAASAIAQKMREDGRYYATCTLTEGGKAGDEAVIFNIVEGPVVRIGGVEYRGNSTKFETGSGRLGTIAKARGPLLGFPTVITPTFTPQVLDIDKKALLFHYHRLGYLDAMIDAEVVPTAADLSTVKIIYHVQEGKPYTVRAVRCEGNTVYDEKLLLNKATEMGAGKIYDEQTVQADATRIGLYYGSGGRKVRVIPEPYIVPNQPNVVDVCYRVLEPQRAPAEGGTPRGQAPNTPDRVGSIIIKGNTFTRERVILNEMRGISPGQILDYRMLEQAEQNLRRRNIFDMEEPPTVTVDDSNQNSEYKDIIVRVRETQTGQAGVQVSVNSNAGLNGTFTVNQRNFDIAKLPDFRKNGFDDLLEGRAFRGNGQELRLTAQPGTVFQRYDATWREPYLNDSLYGLTVNAAYTGRSYNEYNENRLGTRITVDHRLANSPIWSASGSFRLEGVNLSNAPFGAPPAITDFLGDKLLLGFRAGLNRDTRDSFLMPSTGSLFDVSFEQILGSYTYPSAVAEFTKFWTLHQARDGGWKGIVALRSQLSVMADNAPVYERIFAGGFRSLRAFQFRGVGPQENGYFTGGTFAFLNTVEYQLPLMANDRVSFVAFCDHGTVNNKVSLDDYRIAVGVGLRLRIPQMGPLPIALDFAVPLRQAPGDIKQLFSFYVGWIGGQ